MICICKYVVMTKNILDFNISLCYILFSEKDENG